MARNLRAALRGPEVAAKEPTVEEEAGFVALADAIQSLFMLRDAHWEKK
jgi:hypothetical protein